MSPADGVSVIPADPGQPEKDEQEMTTACDLQANVANHLLSQLVQSGNIAQNNFITVQKVVDYDYLENKRMVTLDEAVGIREVASKVNPGGPGPAGP